jgi:hypothetical protein
MTSRGMQIRPASQNIWRETRLPTNSHRFDAYLFTMLRCLECPLKNGPQIRHTCKREVLIVTAAANTGRKRVVHLREPVAGIRSVRNPDAMHMREIFGDFPRAIHERTQFFERKLNRMLHQTTNLQFKILEFICRELLPFVGNR